ncbi:MAG: amidase family protein [Bacteroidota bacterium]
MRDIHSVQREIQAGELRLEDLLDEYLERIEQKNPEVNAFVSVEAAEAREEAKEIQKKMTDGSAGRLAGAVVGIKDLICERGKKTQCASGILEGFESVYDATAVERLKREDALLIGRLNMDEFAMGSSNENSIYGPVKNPHDTTRVAGGSSGGSAAAVAADFCNLTLGSDTGGSIRQPASYCGVVGLKPTYGRVSRHGLIAFASSFDCIGPLSSTVEDAALSLSVLAGKDEMDGTSSDRNVPDYLSIMKESGTLRVGVPAEYFGDGLNDDVRDRVESVLSELESKADVVRVPIALPHMKYSIATYYILATAEASSNLARYDGIRYGHRGEISQVRDELAREREAIENEFKEGARTEASLEEALQGVDSPLIRLYKHSRTEGFGDEVKRRIILGTYVLSSGYYDAYYAKAQKVRRLIRQDFEQAFSNVDLIVSPTAPTTAFPLGSAQDDPVQMYLNDIYTTSANLAGICGISVPVGMTEDGLPVGMQFMANRFEEGQLFRAGSRVQEILS